MLKELREHTEDRAWEHKGDWFYFEMELYYMSNDDVMRNEMCEKDCEVITVAPENRSTPACEITIRKGRPDITFHGIETSAHVNTDRATANAIIDGLVKAYGKTSDVTPAKALEIILDNCPEAQKSFDECRVNSQKQIEGWKQEKKEIEERMDADLLLFKDQITAAARISELSRKIAQKDEPWLNEQERSHLTK